MRSLLLAAIAAASLAAGCDDEDEAPPPPPPPSEDVVAEAASATFGERTLQVELATRSFEGSGLVEPRRGRFRIEVERVNAGGPALRARAVVGQQGTGFDSTVIEGPLWGGHEGNCWFNSHAPAGYLRRDISVEESVRAVGAVLESLRDEAREVIEEGDLYEVVLAPSAAEPGDRDRAWGSRGLLRGATVEVALSPDRSQIEEIAVTLADYEPYSIARGGVQSIPQVEVSVEVSAELTPTDQRLEIDPPRCQAIE
jgi:hypothetical protein